MKKIILPISAIAMFASFTSFANEPATTDSENKLYIGGAIGSTEIDDFESATSFELIGGYQLNESFALEVSYIDFGSAEYEEFDDIEAEADALTVGVVGSINLSEQFSLLAKAGFASWDAELKGWGDSASDDGTDLFYGVGGEYKVTDSVSIGARYTIYDLDGDDATVASVNLKVAL